MATITVRSLAAAALAAAAFSGQAFAQGVPTTQELPAATGPAASACALRPVQYQHGRLKGTFLIGGAADQSLKREAVFAKRRVQINTDGAPNSYHSDVINGDDPGVGAVNIICNAGTKLYDAGWWSYLLSFFAKQEAIACYSKSGISVDPRYAEIYMAVKANDWKPAAGHKITFNWNILAEAPAKALPDSLPGSARPCIADGGFFVTKTKLASHAPKEACDQSAWLDANEVKAFVLPQHWFVDWTSAEAARWASFQPGDVVVAYRPAEGGQPEAWTYGIVGDAGPLEKFGEATLAFNWQLHRKTGVIRDEIRTYRKAVELDTDTLDPQQVPVLILEGTAPALAGDYSPANIEASARDVFAKWGGEQRFKACLSLLK